MFAYIISSNLHKHVVNWILLSSHYKPGNWEKKPTEITVVCGIAGIQIKVCQIHVLSIMIRSDQEQGWLAYDFQG